MVKMDWSPIIVPRTPPVCDGVYPALFPGGSIATPVVDGPCDVMTPSIGSNIVSSSHK